MTKSLTGKFAAFAAVAVLALSGCKQDPDNVTINVPSSKQVAKVTYVIQAMEAGGGPISGAKLTYINTAGAGVNVTGATDGNGNLVVQNVAPGNLAGTLSHPEFGAINFVADVTKAGNDTAYTAVTRVYMFPRSAALRGKVYGNYDMNGNVPSPNTNGDVKAVEMMLTYKLVTTGADAYPMGSGPGRLVNINLEPMSAPATQGDGSSEFFQFTQMYSTESGMIQAYLSMVPLRVSRGTGPTQRDSTFALVAGSPRNSLRVNMIRNTDEDNSPSVGNLLAKPILP